MMVVVMISYGVDVWIACWIVNTVVVVCDGFIVICLNAYAADLTAKILQDFRAIIIMIQLRVYEVRQTLQVMIL